MIALLIDDPEIYTTAKNNPLYDESSSAFKSDSDIFSLFGLVEAYQELNEKNIIEAFRSISFRKEGIYFDLEDRIIRKIKKKKLVQMLGAYKNVKFSFLAKRLGEDVKVI